MNFDRHVDEYISAHGRHMDGAHESAVALRELLLKVHREALALAVKEVTARGRDGVLELLAQTYLKG